MLSAFSYLLAPGSLERRLMALRHSAVACNPNLSSEPRSSQRLSDTASSCQAVGAQRLELAAHALLPEASLCDALDELENLCNSAWWVLLSFLLIYKVKYLNTSIFPLKKRAQSLITSLTSA